VSRGKDGGTYVAGSRRPLGGRERRGWPVSPVIAVDRSGDAELDSAKAGPFRSVAWSGKRRRATEKLLHSLDGRMDAGGHVGARRAAAVAFGRWGRRERAREEGRGVSGEEAGGMDGGELIPSPTCSCRGGERRLRDGR
jgi:hypothetical protein